MLTNSVIFHENFLMQLQSSMGKKLGCFKTFANTYNSKRIQALPLHSLPYFRSRMPTLEQSAMPLKSLLSCILYLVGNVARFYETKKVFVHKLPWSIFMSEMVTFEFPSRFNIEWPSKKSFLLRRNWPKSRRNLQTYKPNL